MTRKIDKKKLKRKIIKSKKAMGKSKELEYNISDDLREEINKYIKEKNITSKNTIPELKEICKIFKIRPYPSLKKDFLELLKIPEASKKNNINGRLSTLQYEAIKDYINKNYEINQPKFEEKDKKAKIEIWELEKEVMEKNEKGEITIKKDKDGNPIKYNSSAFGNDKCDINKGDHIYGIREGLKKIGVIGSNSLWNMVPCTQKQNVSWKNVLIDGKSKNLIYDDFTQEEIDSFDKNTSSKYTKLNKWKKYCNERGAKLFWINGIEINKIITQEINPILSLLNQKLESLEIISQEKEKDVKSYSDKDIALINEDDEKID
jgi:hypothetical protein